MKSFINKKIFRALFGLIIFKNGRRLGKTNIFVTKVVLLLITTAIKQIRIMMKKDKDYNMSV